MKVQVLLTFTFILLSPSAYGQESAIPDYHEISVALEQRANTFLHDVPGDPIHHSAEELDESILQFSSDPDVTRYVNEQLAEKYGSFFQRGYTLTLHFNNGAVQKLFFCFLNQERRVLRIGGSNYTPREE